MTPKTREIARKLARLQRQLMETLPTDADELELSVVVDGEEYAIRVFWGRCVLIACPDDRSAMGDRNADAGETLKLPAARDASGG